MHRYIAIFFVLLSSVHARKLLDDLAGRSVKGVDTSIEYHPYQVSLQTKDGEHFCGGSIINHDTIVTAAHCLDNQIASEINIRLGSSYYNRGGVVAAVRRFAAHEGYNAETRENDIAVIKMDRTVNKSIHVRFITLAKHLPANGTISVVTGWAASRQNVLQRVELEFIEMQTCASNDFKYGSTIRGNMVCACVVRQDACQGDGGGPLVADSTLVGVVSWGNGCGRASYPGVYTNIGALRRWIYDTAAVL